MLKAQLNFGRTFIFSIASSEVILLEDRGISAIGQDDRQSMSYLGLVALLCQQTRLPDAAMDAPQKPLMQPVPNGSTKDATRTKRSGQETFSARTVNENRGLPALVGRLMPLGTVMTSPQGEMLPSFGSTIATLATSTASLTAEAQPVRSATPEGPKLWQQ